MSSPRYVLAVIVSCVPALDRDARDVRRQSGVSDRLAFTAISVMVIAIGALPVTR